MGETVNLNKFRKARARAEARAKADANAAKFGRSKAEAAAEAQRAERLRALVEGHRLDQEDADAASEDEADEEAAEAAEAGHDLSYALRRAVPEDAPAIAALICATLRQGAAAHAPADLARLIEGCHPDALAAELQSRFTLVAVTLGPAGERIVATGALATQGAMAEVKSLFVAPAFQRRGLGAALVTALIARVRARGGASARGRVRVESSPAAEGFYRRMGFRPTGAAPGPGGTAVEMLLELPEG